MISELHQPRQPMIRSKASAKAGRGLVNALEAVHLLVVPVPGNTLRVKKARVRARKRTIRETVLLADEGKGTARGRTKTRTSDVDQAQTAVHPPTLPDPIVVALNRHGLLVEKARVSAKDIRRLAVLRQADVIILLLAIST